MKIDAARGRLRLLTPALCVAALLAVSGSTVAFASAGSSRPPLLAGTWSGKYGGAFSGTFKLHWKQTGSKLIGSIALSKPRGTYRITGSVRGGVIKFGAVGVGAVYTGALSGRSSMSGRYMTPQGGGPWSAHKTA